MAMRPYGVVSHITTCKYAKPCTLAAHFLLRRLPKYRTAFMIRKLAPSRHLPARAKSPCLFHEPLSSTSSSVSILRANPGPLIQNPYTTHFSRLPTFVLRLKHTAVDPLHNIRLRPMPHHSASHHISRTRAHPISNRQVRQHRLC
jgi:hypothetical protein